MVVIIIIIILNGPIMSSSPLLAAMALLLSYSWQGIVIFSCIVIITDSIVVTGIHGIAVGWGQIQLVWLLFCAEGRRTGHK